MHLEFLVKGTRFIATWKTLAYIAIKYYMYIITIVYRAVDWLKETYNVPFTNLHDNCCG